MTKNQTHPGLRITTGVSAGNPASDNCYINRNMNSIACALAGWPQNNKDLPACVGNNNEIWLKQCLNESGEKDWWRSFPDCTSAEQCKKISGNYKVLK